MSKLTKAEYTLHQQACDLLAKDHLTFDERFFVLENWQESARHVNSQAGAFFTPLCLARGLALEVGESRSVIDLCAGIGRLAWYAVHRGWGDGAQVTCVEVNPDYAEVGQKILPEATWIVASVFDLPAGLGGFDMAISNPPFGRTPRDGKAPRYNGPDFDYHVIDIASDLAEWGAFIVPAMSAPFRFSGRPYYEERTNARHDRLLAETGIHLRAGCGVDTSASRSEWRGTAPDTEIVVADFSEARATRQPAQGSLFEGAA